MTNDQDQRLTTNDQRPRRVRICRRRVPVSDMEPTMPTATRGPIAAFAGIAVLISSLAHAQTIAGTVRDESGAVMPGVTVEASSPVLIEKVRTGTTDSAGQYRIINLSPGVYTVTFTLPGFSTVRREGIELTGNFTATVNSDLKVGSIEETVTVSGASPLVDVQSLTKQ